MDLPDWIDQPVPGYSLDPIHDAVGKLVQRCQVLETFLGLVAEQLTGRQPSGRPSDYLKDMRNHLDKIPEPDRHELAGELDVAEQVLKVRNTVVHGFWDSTYEGRHLATIRTARWDRTAKDWAPLVFSRDLLIGSADRAHQIFLFLQSRSSHWPDVHDV